MKTAIPPAVLTAIPTIKWPLHGGSSPPLNFVGLDTMKEIRSKQGEVPFVSLSPNHPLRLDPRQVLNEVVAETMSQEQKEYMLVSTAFVLLGNGLTDEAHNLITPCTWPEETHFGFGPNQYTTVASGPKAFATYLHALIHRREGFNLGEFGMTGWQNAFYWSKAYLSSSGCNLLPHQDLNKQLKTLFEAFSDEQDVADWVHDHEMLLDEQDIFESRAVHVLCCDVMKGGKSGRLRKFAELVSEMEIRVLLFHSLKGAGCECSLEDVAIEEFEHGDNNL